MTSRKEKVRTIRFKINYWSFEETEDNELFIYIGGLMKPDAKGYQKSVLIRVDDFHPYGYLELPRDRKWDGTMCKRVFEHLSGTLKEHGPLTYECMRRNNIYYNVPLNVMMLTFRTKTALAKAASNFRYYSKTISGLGTFEKDSFKLHEANIDPILKFATLYDIKMAGWIQVKEYILDEDAGVAVGDRSFAHTDVNMYVKASDVTPVEEDIALASVLKYLSFDIECYSYNHNSKIPDPLEPRNHIFQIGVTCGRLGSADRKKYLLVLGECSDIDDVEIRSYKKEKDLLLGFTDLVNDENPDVMMGFNILKFDWDYMIIRAEKLEIIHEFSQMTRLVGKRGDVVTKNWASSAYGNQVFRYMEIVGRIQIDAMPEIERNHKLPSYSLNAVAEYFMGEKKEDITALQLFMLRKAYMEMTELRKKGVPLKEVIACGSNNLKLRACSGQTLAYRKRIRCATEVDIDEIIYDSMKMVGTYCVQDTVLVVNLVEKLNMFTGMEAMANIVSIPMSYLTTRGQQIRVLAQMLRKTIETGHIIPAQNGNDESDERYEGATVIDPVPGYYENVPSYDFASLYPSMLICYNLDFTTFIAEDDSIPDSECNVITVDSHVACIVQGTPVTLADRSVPIETLVNSTDKVWSWNGKGIELKQQTNFFKRGRKKCIELTLFDGTKIRCTEDHKILTANNEWVEAKDLTTEGDCVDYVRVGLTKPTHTLDEDMKACDGFEINFGAFDKRFKKNLKWIDIHYDAQTLENCSKLLKFSSLLGLLLSDGSIANNDCTIYLGHMLDVKTVCDDIEFICGMRPYVQRKQYTWSVLVPSSMCKGIHSLPGIMHGKRLSQKYTLPEFLLHANCPLPVIRSFLRGLFDGDGISPSCGKNSNTFTSIGLIQSCKPEFDESLKNWMNNISLMLKKFDIDTSVNSYYKKKWDQTAFVLRLNTDDVIKFYECIGSKYCCHKAARIMAVVSYFKHRNEVMQQRQFVYHYVKNKTEKTTQKALDRAHEIINEGAVYNPHYSLPTLRLIHHLCYRTEEKIQPRFSKKYFPTISEYLQMLGATDFFMGTNRKHQYAVHFDATEFPTITLPVIHKRDIGMQDVYDIEVEDNHSFLANGIVVHNCEHDPKKRKATKKKPPLCISNKKYRFKKVRISPDGTRENEGLLPIILRNLLSERKVVKKQMGKLQARLNMHIGKATKEDIEEFKSKGIEIIEKGSLSKEEEKTIRITIGVLDANQLALKVSANSIYGATGVKKGFMPLIPIAASVTSCGRKSIFSAIEYILKHYDYAKLVYGDTDSVMLNFEGKNLQECFDISEECVKRVTHYLRCKLLEVEEDFTVKYVDPKTKKSTKCRLNEVEKIAKTLGIDVTAFMNGMSDAHRIKKWEYDGLHLELAFETIYGKYLMLSKKRYICESVNRKGEVMKMVKKGVVLARRDNCLFYRDSFTKVIKLVLKKAEYTDVLYSVLDSVHRLFTRQVPPEHLVIFMGVKDVISYSKKEEVMETVIDRGRPQKVKKLYYIDHNGNRFDDPVGAHDPRLVLSNIPQGLLSRKMIRRGDIIPANTRLEFIYLHMDNYEHQGEKAEDFTYYKEHRRELGLKPDLLHYLEKQFINAIKEVLDVKFPPQYHKYVSPEEAYEAALKSAKIGEVELLRLRRCKKPILRFRYVHENLKKSTHNLPLFNAVHRILSKDVLDRIYKKHGLPIRKAYNKPTTKVGRQSGMCVVGGDLFKDILDARTHYSQVVAEYRYVIMEFR